MIFIRALLIIAILGCFNLSNGHVFILDTNLPQKELEFLLSNFGATQQPDSLLNIRAEYSTVSMKLPEGVVVHINYKPSETEFIICERIIRKSKASNLTETAKAILQEDQYVDRFQEKGFLFQTKRERCRGLLYNTAQNGQEVALVRDYIQKAVNIFYPVIIDKEKQDASDFSSVSMIIKSNRALMISFQYNDIKAAHFSKKIRFEDVEGGFKPASIKGTYESKYKGDELLIYSSPNYRPDRKTLEINAISTLEGSGLHQKIIRDLVFDSKSRGQKRFSAEEDCNIVLLDFLTEQTYVDQDEIRYKEYMELKRFEVLDIEKPTETAKQYAWLIRMKLSELQNISGTNEKLNISYPVHFRYQSPREESFANSTLFLKTKFFTDCKFNGLLKKDDEGFYEQKMRELYNATYIEIPMKHFQSQNDLKDGKVSDNITIQIPVGEIALKPLVTLVTLVVSIGGAAAILYFILMTKKPHIE